MLLFSQFSVASFASKMIEQLHSLSFYLSSVSHMALRSRQHEAIVPQFAVPIAFFMFFLALSRTSSFLASSVESISTFSSMSRSHLHSVYFVWCPHFCSISSCIPNSVFYYFFFFFSFFHTSDEKCYKVSETVSSYWPSVSHTGRTVLFAIVISCHIQWT